MSLNEKLNRWFEGIRSELKCHMKIKNYPGKDWTAQNCPINSYHMTQTVINEPARAVNKQQCNLLPATWTHSKMDADNSLLKLRNKSRQENTKEEKRKQRREWKKRKFERRKAKPVLVAAPAETNVQPDKLKDSEVETNGANTAKYNEEANSTSEIPKSPFKALASSRGALMVQMARSKVVKPSFFTTEAPLRRSTESLKQDIVRVEKQSVLSKQLKQHVRAVKDCEDSSINIKELNPEHIVYMSENLVGSGSYGQCYRARYRGIEVLVKKMTHDGTARGKEKARKNVFHEAKVLSALGDHAKLPMIFGVISETEPLCIVSQFHGVKHVSVTLHHAAREKLLSPYDCIEIFLEICSALRHVHFKGYIHNDIKANNVVLDRKAESKKYEAVLIDFGKSTKAQLRAPPLYSRKRSTPASHGKCYLAPEVLKEGLYSTASDVYSLGIMLKSVSSLVGCYPQVRALVKEATAEKPTTRPRLSDFTQKLSAVKF